MAIKGVASEGTDGYRQQIAVVNGQVTGGTGDAAGVYLVGGGKAVIGGRVGSDSGIAVHAARKLDTDLAPHLLVNFVPEGKRISSLIGDDWILNDGGGTTIAINGFVIHDKTDGVTGTWAPNGAWDVAIRNEGVKVTDRTSDDWTTETVSGALDRDFSAEDFVRVRAARSAIYEVLPAFLLRLDEVVPEGGGNRLQSPNSELWLRVNSKFVSNAKRDGNIGTQCRSNLSSVSVGTNFSTVESNTGFVAGRMVHGEVRVESPVGGGRIGATGVGIVTGITQQVTDDIYLKGQISANRYRFYVHSANYGSLGSRFDAWGLGYRAEVGQHFESRDETWYTMRAWLDGKLMLLDRHIDAVRSNVSLKDGHELFVGAGLTAKSVSYIGGSEQAVTWRGSIGVEVPIDGLTKVNLSGEPLSSKAPNTRLRFGFGADWRHGDINFNTAIEANGADARETAFQFRVGMKF